MNPVATNIKSKREALGISQEFVADKLGITSRAYQNYEYGDREPRMATLRKIAKVFGISVNDLIGEQNVPQATSGATNGSDMDYLTITPSKPGLIGHPNADKDKIIAQLQEQVKKLELEKEKLYELLKNSLRK